VHLRAPPLGLSGTACQCQWTSSVEQVLWHTPHCQEPGPSWLLSEQQPARPPHSESGQVAGRSESGQPPVALSLRLALCRALANGPGSGNVRCNEGVAMCRPAWPHCAAARAAGTAVAAAGAERPHGPISRDSESEATRKLAQLYVGGSHLQLRLPPSSSKGLCYSEPLLVEERWPRPGQVRCNTRPMSGPGALRQLE
jgi:hypothetical protein